MTTKSSLAWLDGMVFHRFEYDPPMHQMVCTPPDAWGKRPEGYCPGCGVIVTDEECCRAAVPYPSDLELDLVVQARLKGISLQALADAR